MRCASFVVLAALASAVAAQPARAAQPQSVQAAPRPANPQMFAAAAAANSRRMSAQQREEWRFLKDAAATGRFEAEASRLALGKSGNPRVRSFAATLINHHTSAGNELLHMLQMRGMASPMMANDQRKTLNRLARLQGAKFDREFMEEVGLKYQQDDVTTYEKASASTRDPQLKAWIDRTLPTLRYHLSMAERIAPPDPKLARGSHAAQAAQATQAAAVEQLTAEPFVSRASLATRSMGAAPAPLDFSRAAAGKR